MITIACAWCKKEIKVSAYRLKKTKEICCSSQCAAYLRFRKKGCYPQRKMTKEKLKEVSDAYQNTSMTIQKIAEKFGVSRGSVFWYAREEGWERKQRTMSIRTQYRKAAASKIGRKLFKGEHVHHIDGQITNNAPENLVVFSNAVEHGIAHGSLEKCAFVLFKLGHILWSDEQQRYYLPQNSFTSSRS